MIVKADPPRFTILAVSDNFLHLTGQTRENVEGKGVFEAFPDDDVNGYAGRLSATNAFMQVIETRQRIDIKEYKYSIKKEAASKAETRYYANSNIPVEDREGNIAYIINTTSDITEQVLMRRKEAVTRRILESQQQRVQNLYMKAPVGIAFLKTGDYVIEFVNEAMCRFWNRGTPAQLTGKKLFEEVLPENADPYLSILDEVVRNNTNFVSTQTPVELDGAEGREIFYFDIMFEPVQNFDGSIHGIAGMCIEVTAQVRARQQLLESRRNLDLAIAAGQMGLWSYDYTKQSFILRSPRFDEIFGYSPTTTAYIDRPQFISHFLPDEFAAYEKAHEEALQTGELFYELRIRTVKGDIRWISVKGIILFDKDKNPVQSNGIVSDITERKKQEQHKDEFISIVSHELKTPITSVKAYTQILQREFEKEQHTHIAGMFGKMQMQVDKLTDIIYDLLDVSRIEAGKLQYNFAEYSFNKLLDEQVEDLRITEPSLSISIEKNGPDKLIGDPERTGQVLTNLISNAIKYSPYSKKINIETSAGNGSLICCVQDFGVGIPGEMQSRIFEKFFRIENKDHSTVSGLGMGLYITSEIIKRQNGRIWFESTINRGSTFYFELPLQQPANPVSYVP